MISSRVTHDFIQLSSLGKLPIDTLGDTLGGLLFTVEDDYFMSGLLLMNVREIEYTIIWPTIECDYTNNH